MRHSLAAERKFTSLQHCSLSSLWFAYNVQWNALIPIILPAQASAIAGQAHKEWINGITLAAGAFVALLTTPLAGALSDRSKNARGRRRPFLLSGIVLNVAALGALGAIGSKAGTTAFIGALLFTQFAGNWWGGAYAGMIPDVAPAEEQGRASGYMMLMTGAGTIVGAGMSGPLLTLGGFASAYLFLIIVLLICTIITLLGVKEPPPPKQVSTLSFSQFLYNFLPNVTRERDFYIVLVTRTFITMGAFSIVPFFQYFFGDVMRDPQAVLHGSILLSGITVATLPVALIAGKQADRRGPKTITWISGWVMSAATAIFIIDCFFPSWPFTIVMGLIFGAASVAYQTVDWALAISVLPARQEPGKDMGIWHISFVLPQAIAPLLSGALLDRTKQFSASFGYSLVFALAAIWYALGTFPIRKISSRRAIKGAEDGTGS